MNSEKEDLRVRRTRTLLYKAILEIINNHSFESITVKQICEHAMVNRATFYKYFMDKYHLLSEAFRELSSQEVIISKDDLSPRDMFKQGLIFANNHKNLFMQVLSEERDSLRGIIKEELRGGLRGHLAIKHSLPNDSIMLDLLTEAHTGAVINVIFWCLENNIKTETEEIYKVFDNFHL
ncbi:TetR/AcrR family transcriptional regulator [Paenibacillus yanchengensis]|uniref:TetR/AcrR family transcriptional regulator n=1 Tax=Paenibacillus yanchengensis TaxID=2035833 RepID=A0ABW4YJ39_9BACL